MFPDKNTIDCYTNAMLATLVVTSITLLISYSIKIFHFQFHNVTVSAFLCPIITFAIAMIARTASFPLQRRILNSGIMTLYLFSIFVFILITMPTTHRISSNVAYQIIFDDIPHKFFAATVSFCLFVYLPAWLVYHLYRKAESQLMMPIVYIISGILFFVSHFYLLDYEHQLIRNLFVDSLFVCLLCTTAALLILLALDTFDDKFSTYRKQGSKIFIQEQCGTLATVDFYLIMIALIISLSSLACEYRLIALDHERYINASAIFFSFIFLIANVIMENSGWQATIRLIIMLLLGQICFELISIVIIAHPSPRAVDLDMFYHLVMPRRLSAATLAVFSALVTNSALLHWLKHYPAFVRYFTANFCAATLLVVVNYGLLYGGIFPYDEIVGLSIHAWIYKVIVCLVTVPLTTVIYKYTQRTSKAEF